MIFKRRQAKFGKTHSDVIKNKMKLFYTFSAITRISSFYTRALELLLTFISRSVGMKILIEKGRVFNKQIKWISKRMRTSVKFRNSKIEVLETKWNLTRRNI